MQSPQPSANHKLIAVYFLFQLERAKAPAPAPAMDMFADDTGQKDSDNKNGDAEDDKFREKSLG